jgi:hypothetical protein
MADRPNTTIKRLGNAVHRVVTEGITPEQALGEAIARLKQILSD